MVENQTQVRGTEPVPRRDRNSLLAHEQLLEKARNGGIDLYFAGDSITRRWGTGDAAYQDFLANWKTNFHQLADRDGKLVEGVTVDGLHLSVKGYQIWADALKPVLTEQLGPPATTDHAPPPTGDPSAAQPRSKP